MPQSEARVSRPFHMTIRLRVAQPTGRLSVLVESLRAKGGAVAVSEPVRVATGFEVRDLIIACLDQHIGEMILKSLRAAAGVEIVNVSVAGRGD